jgi:hypothetical protein
MVTRAVVEEIPNLTEGGQLRHGRAEFSGHRCVIG